jgi:hypothetical protein
MQRIIHDLESFDSRLHMSDCKYMIQERCTNRLALPLYGAQPSPGVCSACEYRNGLRGLGDALAWVLSFTSAKRIQSKGCGGCKRRQAALNRAVPARPCRQCAPTVDKS